VKEDAVSLNLKNAVSPGRTASREVRRRQLIEATIDSIAERGFSGTTLAVVTKGANLSHGLVNFHFKNKETLFSETIRFLAEEHRAQWLETVEKAGSTPLEKLLALIDTNFHPNICNRRKLSVWFAFFGESKYRSIYRDRCAEIDTERMNETERLCRLINEEGAYDRVDPGFVARGLEAFMDGLWLNMLIYPKTFSRSEAKKECIAYLAAIFENHFSAPANSQACNSK
jgi:TetR/AcrR family transcriptional repressor of bet genes